MTDRVVVAEKVEDDCNEEEMWTYWVSGRPDCG